MNVAIGSGLGLYALLDKGVKIDLILSPKKKLIRRYRCEVYPDGTDGGSDGGIDVWGGALGWPLTKDDDQYFSALFRFMSSWLHNKDEAGAYERVMRDNVSEHSSLMPVLVPRDVKDRYKSLIKDIPRIDGIATLIDCRDGYNITYKSHSEVGIVKANSIYLCCGAMQTKKLLVDSGLIAKTPDAFKDTLIYDFGVVKLESEIEIACISKVLIKGIRHRRVCTSPGGGVAFYLVPGVRDASFSDVVKIKKTLSGVAPDYLFFLRNPAKSSKILFQLFYSEFISRKTDTFYVWISARPDSFNSVSKFVFDNLHQHYDVQAYKENTSIKIESALHLRNSLPKDTLERAEVCFRLVGYERLYVSNLAAVSDDTARNPGVFLF